MRAVIQRVAFCEVHINNMLFSKIDKGLLVLIGIEGEDLEKDMDYILDKMMNLRVFPDDSGNMNLSVLDIKGEIMIVSQFTLYGDCRKGRRPSFSRAMKPADAEKLYSQFVSKAKEYPISISEGKFQAMMEVKLLNEGPVTLLLDSKKDF